jgi:hypothetical protein
MQDVGKNLLQKQIKWYTKSEETNSHNSKSSMKTGEATLALGNGEYHSKNQIMPPTSMDRLMCIHGYVSEYPKYLPKISSHMIQLSIIIILYTIQSTYW